MQQSPPLSTSRRSTLSTSFYVLGITRETNVDATGGWRSFHSLLSPPRSLCLHGSSVRSSLAKSSSNRTSAPIVSLASTCDQNRRHRGDPTMLMTLKWSLASSPSTCCCDLSQSSVKYETLRRFLYYKLQVVNSLHEDTNFYASGIWMLHAATKIFRLRQEPSKKSLNLLNCIFLWSFCTERTQMHKYIYCCDSNKSWLILDAIKLYWRNHPDVLWRTIKRLQHRGAKYQVKSVLHPYEIDLRPQCECIPTRQILATVYSDEPNSKYVQWCAIWF